MKTSSKGAQGNSLILVKHICILMYVYINSIYTVYVSMYHVFCISTYYHILFVLYAYVHLLYHDPYQTYIYIYIHMYIGCKLEFIREQVVVSTMAFGSLIWLINMSLIVAFLFRWEMSKSSLRCFFGKHSEEIAASDFPLESEF